jgi:hypothetical protein
VATALLGFRRRRPGRGTPPDPVLALLDELLEAQLDTIELLGAYPRTPRRQAHIGYLQALHRFGQCVGAHVAVLDDPLAVDVPAAQPGPASGS